MKARIFCTLLIVAFAIPLAGCPKKTEEGDGVEKVEGSSTVDKSGEGSSEEMQEKKASPTETTPEAGEAEKK